MSNAEQIIKHDPEHVQAGKPRGRQQVARIEPQRSPVPSTPMEMLGLALQQNANVDVLEKLLALQERWEAGQARKAFDAAMAEARAEIPVIKKNRHVGFKSKKEGAAKTDYYHEDLAEIARTVDPVLSRHGLSYRYRTTSKPNEPVSVTCIVSHRLGHFEENTLSAGRDDSGNKNSIQAVGSAITYLQRYTLKAALGLAASNDDDGESAGQEEMVSAEQITGIRALMQDVKADEGKFLTYLKVEKIEDLPAAHYQRAIEALSNYAARQK